MTVTITLQLIEVAAPHATDAVPQLERAFRIQLLPIDPGSPDPTLARSYEVRVEDEAAPALLQALLERDEVDAAYIKGRESAPG